MLTFPERIDRSTLKRTAIEMKRAIIITMITMIVCQFAYCESSDFLANEDRFNSTKIMYNDVDYIGLRKSVEKYIIETDPAQSDSAYRILEILNDTSEAIDAENEVIDDFDGSRGFTLDGVTEINDKYCVVPGYDEERWLNAALGFISDNWVFFDSMAISIDGKVVCEESYDNNEIITDVLDDGRVREMVYRPIDFIEYNDVVKMVNAGKVIIRFSNSKTDAKFDHVLTEEEIAAIYHCFQLLKTRTTLSNFYWNYSH